MADHRVRTVQAPPLAPTEAPPSTSPSHALQDASPRSDAEVRATKPARTPDAADLAARAICGRLILEAHAIVDGASLRNSAERIGFDESLLRRIGKGEDPIRGEKLFRLPRRVQRALALLWLQELDEAPDAPRSLDDAAERAEEAVLDFALTFKRARRDGHVDTGELRDLQAKGHTAIDGIRCGLDAAEREAEGE